MLQVRLLGQFDVRADGKRVVIPSRAGQSLFAYLLLSAGTAHRRERLAGLLWPDTSDDHARRNLRQELWRVRKAIGSQRASNGEYIQAEEFTVTFNPEADYWLDVAQLDRPVVTEDALNDLINQLGLYQGELLPGFYDDWIVLERERVQASFENKMKQLMEALCREQRWSTVLEWGERWIALGQAPEPAYRALMLAYAALGDRSKVVATFERGQAALDKELGVEPSDETRHLYTQLLQGAEVASVDLSTTHIAPVRLRTVDEPPAPGEPPFKGLQYFDETDAALFFGRELLTAKLVQHVRESQFLAVVVGASGSGKSSIVRAGLVPALKKGESLADGTLPPEGSRDWRFEVITPTAHPLEALAMALTREVESVTATATLMDDLARDPRSLALYLRRTLTPRIARPSPFKGEGRGEGASHVLLVVDQFEELFTLCRDEFEREAFIDNLLTALTPSPSRDDVHQERGRRSGGGGEVTLILTIRADFYAYLAQYPELREAVAQQQEYIGPMTADELRRAIEEPAKHGGWEFESGLVDWMLRDVGDEPGALPLLSHALLETWKRRSGRTLTLKGYADAGGVRGAIAYTAETVYQQLSTEQQAIARNIFLRLTELGEGTEDTRRRATIMELVTQPEQADQVRGVLNILADARLITLGEDSAEVAHEALIREWPRLRDWLNEDREGLLLHRHLTEATYEWEVLDRDPGALYRGARLAQASEWAATNASALNRQEQAFLGASQELEQQEAVEHEAQRQRELEAAHRLAEEQQRRADEQSRNAKRLRRRAIVLAGAFILAIIMASAALFFGEQARQRAIDAQAASRTAAARELAASAISNLTADPERSILLALQAVTTTYSIDASVLPEAEQALHRAAQASHIQFTLLGHTAEVAAVAFSPDGKRLATLGQEGNTIIWDTTTGKELFTLPGHAIHGNKLAIGGLAFSPDGARLATTDNNVVKVWDVISGQDLLTLSGHTGEVRAVAFSPDGKRIATGGDDKIMKVWDATNGQPLNSLAGHTDAVVSIAFSPDGARIATGSFDNTAKVWDAATGKELLTLSGFTYFVNSVAFSTDGKRLATVSTNVNVWDAATGESINLFNPAEPNVVAFSPDGTRLAIGHFDGDVTLLDASSGKMILTLPGHTAIVNSIAFSPDGTRLASASSDKTVKVWDITADRELLSVSRTPAPINRVAYSPDGTRFLTGSDDGLVNIWDAATGKELLVLKGHTGGIYGISVSRDGTRIATASYDGTAKVWDAATGKLLLTVNHPPWVRGVAFSPDGARLATASTDDTAKVWDAASGKELLTLSGHTNGVSSIAFSPDGTRLATSSWDQTAREWDVATGKELFTLSGHKDAIWALAFSPDGSRIATASVDHTAKVWDPATGKELLTLSGHTGPVWSVAFSPDGTQIATGSGDKTVKVWDAVSGKELHTIPGHAGGIFGVAFSPDGMHVATASGDGTSRIYVLRIEDLVELAKSRLTRSLTTEECQKYLHVEECPAP